MAWRRKPDGRPFADVMRHGTRYRESLLTPDLIEAGPPWPDDDTCQAMYDLWLVHRLPELLDGKPQGATHRDHTPDTPEHGNPTLESLCSWYVDTVMVSRGNAEGTRRTNKVLFTGFVDWMQQNNAYTFADLERTHLLDEWVSYRLKAHAATTVRRESVVLRAVFRAALDRKIIPHMPVTDWPRPKVPEKYYDEPLTVDEIRRVLDWLKTSGYNHKRPRAGYHIIIFVAHTGCRPIDACRLRKDRLLDLDTDMPQALIRQQKTGKLVAIALTKPAVEAVKAGLTPENTTPYVWPSRYGRPRGSAQVYCDVVQAGRALNIKITPRRFRESLISVLSDQGADQHMIQAITGHRSEAIQAYRRLRRGAAHALANAYATHLETTENVTPDVTDPT